MSPQPNETADSVVFNLETHFVKCHRCYEKYQSIWWEKPHDCEVVKRYPNKRFLKINRKNI